MSFRQPDISCVSVFMSFGSFMKRMSQAAVNDLLTCWSRREDGVQCFSFCLFKDTSPPYVRAAQGSFTLMHSNLFDLMAKMKSWHLTGLRFMCTEGHQDGRFVCVYVTEMQEMTSYCPHCYWCETDGPEFLNESRIRASPRSQTEQLLSCSKDQ